jgi:hypothetical protein
VADYRFSAKVIKRSNGQSAVAAAAYRAGERLLDDRTGQTADYSRKAGVIHAEVMTPEGTPDWMRDRAQLWNAVEAAERRKDAQLAREIQLSLPHELDQAQRKALLLDFVQEQFVGKGMIADIAIHAPNAEGDQRNHHAHVMLTMRELTGEGFGNKARDWNSPDQLAQWREQWAHHQNRTLERYGHAARVDHRSFEAQGVDRAPTQHLGPTASDMERGGKASRIGNENRAIDSANTERAHNQIEAARLASQKARFETWAQGKSAELEAAQDLTKLDLDQKHHKQRLRLEARLRDDYGQAKATIKAEMQAIDRRLEAKGVKKILRDVFGRSRNDKTNRENMAASLRDIQIREAERRQALAARQDKERGQLHERQEQRQQAQARGIEKARQRAEGARTPKAPQKPRERPAKPFPTPTAAKPSQAHQRAAQPPVDPLDKPTLADQKTNPARKENDGSPSATLKRPWQRSSLSNDNERPWQRDSKPAGRERSPSRPKTPKR